MAENEGPCLGEQKKEGIYQITSTVLRVSATINSRISTASNEMNS